MIEMLYDCFKHWTSNGRLFVMADPHFKDDDCIKMCPNWISPEEHIAIINKKCKKSDTLLILGDLGDPECVKQIKAKKVLVAGNHDIIARYRDIISEIYTGPLFIAEKILVSHERIEGLKWAINIHGHDHAGMFRWTDAQGAKHMNVASNILTNWEPIDLGEEIKKGLVSHIYSIHQTTIETATIRSIQKKNKIARKNGEPEITYQRPQKKKKAPQPPVTPAKTPEEKQRALCERYCLNCPKASTKNENDLLAGKCSHHNEKTILVIDKTNPNPLINLVFDGQAVPQLVGTQRIVKCPSCPAMMATINSLTAQK